MIDGGMMSDSDVNRMAPAASAPAAYDGADATGVAHYGSAQRRAVWAIACLSAITIAILVEITASVIQIGQLNQVVAGTPPPQSDLERSDHFLFVGAIGYSFAFVASVVAFAMWFHRAYRNLPALGAKNLLTKPGWAAGCWFIPVLNLFRPYQAAREIVVYSDPAYTGEELASAIGAPALLKSWWAAWIIANVLSRPAMKVTEHAVDAHSLIGARVLSSVVAMMLLAAACMAILIIRRATYYQDARILHFSQLGADVAPMNPAN
jgi:hypothetical protein